MLAESHMIKLAHAVAHKYQRRAWWATHDDLVQEAVIAILKAQRTYNPNAGTPEGFYCYRAALYAVSRYLWQESAPVSGGKDRPSKHLCGLHRASEEVLDTVEGGSTPEEQLHACVVHQVLRGRMLSHLARMPLAPESRKERVALVERLLACDPPTGGRFEEYLRARLTEYVRSDKDLCEALRPHQ